MIEAEAPKLKALSLHPDTATYARLTTASLKPFYLWLATEMHAGTPPEKLFGALGQMFGNFAYITAARAVQPHEVPRALRAVIDTAIAKIGNRVGHKPGIILPGQ